MTDSSLRDDLHDAVADLVHKHQDRMVLRSLVVYESLDGVTGQRVMTVVPSADTRTWDVMAMTQWAAQLAEFTVNCELAGSDER